MIFEEMLEKVDTRDRGGDLRRMDIAVDPERRLFARRAARSVGHCGDPDVAAFVAPADRFDAHQLRQLGCKRLEQLGQFGVAIEAVELNVRHEDFGYGQSAQCGRGPAVSQPFAYARRTG